jgi:hypothetical protein
MLKHCCAAPLLPLLAVVFVAVAALPPVIRIGEYTLCRFIKVKIGMETSQSLVFDCCRKILIVDETQYLNAAIDNIQAGNNLLFNFNFY